MEWDDDEAPLAPPPSDGAAAMAAILGGLQGVYDRLQGGWKPERKTKWDAAMEKQLLEARRARTERRRKQATHDFPYATKAAKARPKEPWALSAPPPLGKPRGAAEPALAEGRRRKGVARGMARGAAHRAARAAKGPAPQNHARWFDGDADVITVITDDGIGRITDDGLAPSPARSDGTIEAMLAQMCAVKRTGTARRAEWGAESLRPARRVEPLRRPASAAYGDGKDPSKWRARPVSAGAQRPRQGVALVQALCDSDELLVRLHLREPVLVQAGRKAPAAVAAETVPALPIEPEVDDDARLWPDDADDGVRKTPIELSRSKRKKKPPRSPSRGKDGKDDAMATAATPKRLKKKALAGSKSQPSQLTSSTSQRILAGSDDAGAAVPAPARAAAAAWCTGDFVLYARGDSTTERKMRVAACTIVDGVVAHLTIVGDGDRVETVPQFVRLAHRAWTDGAEEGRPIVDGGSAGVGYRRRTLVARGGAGVGDGAGASDGARTSDAAASRIQAHARRGAAQRAIERERRLRDDQGPAVTTLQARLRGRAARGVPARRSSAAATIQAHARGRQRRSPRASSDARGVNADVARDAAATRPQARSRAFLAMHERHRHRSATTLQAAMRARAATRKAAAMRTAAARGAARDITLSVCNTTFVARYAISQLSSV